MEGGWKPVVIGRTEYVQLPEWGIRNLRAKVDTGAKTSALHVEAIRRAGRSTVEFDVVLARGDRKRTSTVQAPITRVARVKSSNGEYDERFFVRTTLRIGPLEREIEVSLVDRERMTHRMLLGRSALLGLLVDCRHTGLVGRPPAVRKVARRRRR